MKRLIQFFNILVCLFPFGMALLFSLIYFTGGWQRWSTSHDLAFYFEFPLTGRIKAFAFWCVAILGILIVKHVFTRWFVYKRIRAIEICVIAIVAVTLRLILIVKTRSDIVPFSDFYRIWQMSHGDLEGNIEYYTLFPPYLNYMIFVRDYLNIVGDAYINMLYANVVLSSGSTVLIYFIAEKITSDKRIPFIAGLLYAFMPANIMYCSVMTPEFLAIFFVCLGLSILLSLPDKELNVSKAVKAFVAGLSIGVGSAYKPFGIIVIIAIGMCLLAWMQLFKVGKKGIVLSGLAFFLILGGYKASKEIIELRTEIQLNIELDDSKSFPHYLLIGLNREGEGQIHLGEMSRLYYQTYLKNGQDAEKAKKYSFHIMMDDWEEHTEQVPAFFVKKMIWAWQDDCVPLRYYNLATQNEEGQDIWWQGGSLATLIQVYYMMLLCLALIECFLICSRKKIDLKIELILLIIHGYFCMILLSEAQSRYKCLVMPFVCIISAAGLLESIDWGKNWISKILNFLRDFSLSEYSK